MLCKHYFCKHPYILKFVRMKKIKLLYQKKWEANNGEIGRIV